MTTLTETITAIVPALVGGGGVWAYLTARAKVKATAPAAMLTSQADLVGALNAQTKIILDEHAKDRRDLKRRVDRLGAQTTKLTAQVTKCEIKHSDCETRVGSLQEQVDQLMRGPVATYPHGGANAAD